MPFGCLALGTGQCPVPRRNDQRPSKTEEFEGENSEKCVRGLGSRSHDLAITFKWVSATIRVIFEWFGDQKWACGGLSVSTPVPISCQCRPKAGTAVQQCHPVLALRQALQCPVPAPWASLECLSPVQVALSAPWFPSHQLNHAQQCTSHRKNLVEGGSRIDRPSAYSPTAYDRQQDQGSAPSILYRRRDKEPPAAPILRGDVCTTERERWIL